MRLLHTSDWHLGRSFHRENLVDAQAAFLDHLVDTIHAERIDVVVVAGDLYDSAALRPIRDEAQRIIAGLVAAFRNDPALLPAGWQRGEGETARLRAIADYIAGMTDGFAIRCHERLVGPVELPDRF